MIWSGNGGQLSVLDVSDSGFNPLVPHCGCRIATGVVWIAIGNQLTKIARDASETAKFGYIKSSIRHMFRIFNRVKPYLDMNASEFESAIRSYRDAVIIDVRTPDEFNIGRISGAINMDITRGDFESWVEELDKDKTYLIYCRGGNRSIAACTIFGSKGLRSCNLAGGIYSWNGQIEGSV